MSEPLSAHEEKLDDLRRRCARERKRFAARRPKRARDVIRSIMSRRGYAAAKASEELQRAWASAASEVLPDHAIASQTRAIGLSRGKLLVGVANGVVMQEVNFWRSQLLQAAQRAAPDGAITSIRFRVG